MFTPILLELLTTTKYSEFCLLKVRVQGVHGFQFGIYYREEEGELGDIHLESKSSR